MNNPELYKKTTDILFEAYFNDKIIHGSCAACAVGNIIAGNIGRELDDSWIGGNFNLPNNSGLLWYRLIKREYISREGLEQIESTGYSVNQISQIEYAFEGAENNGCDDEWMFNGLCAVIDVLNEIHEVDQDEQKPRFKAHYQTLVS